MGPTTVGLVYVNLAGPKGSEVDHLASAADVRWTFGLMGLNDTETESHIGGGHSFGKCYRSCSNLPCGRITGMEGMGPNTFTSGFEGQ